MEQKNNQGTVLIVDDELPFRKIYSDVLTHEGYEVLEAEDGKKALEIIKSEKPDVIMLDIVMPKLDGYEVLQRLKSQEETKDIPVIVYTVINEDQQVQKALSLGAEGYAIKGFTPAVEVVEKVKNALAL